MAGLGLYEMVERIVEAGIPCRLDPDSLEQLRMRGRT